MAPCMHACHTLFHTAHTHGGMGIFQAFFPLPPAWHEDRKDRQQDRQNYIFVQTVWDIQFYIIISFD